MTTVAAVFVVAVLVYAALWWLWNRKDRRIRRMIEQRDRKRMPESWRLRHDYASRLHDDLRREVSRR